MYSVPLTRQGCGRWFTTEGEIGGDGQYILVAFCTQCIYYVYCLRWPKVQVTWPILAHHSPKLLLAVIILIIYSGPNPFSQAWYILGIVYYTLHSAPHFSFCFGGSASPLDLMFLYEIMKAEVANREVRDNSNWIQHAMDWDRNAPLSPDNLYFNKVITFWWDQYPPYGVDIRCIHRLLT